MYEQFMGDFTYLDSASRQVQLFSKMDAKKNNLVPRASVTFVQRMGQRTLWKNPKPEPQNPGSGLTALA